MAKKYIKDEKGIVRAITSNNLQLEKPLLNENYDIEVHNRNMDKIDNAIQEVKGKVDGLELTAQRVSIADSANKFEATNVEDALLENKTSISLLNTKADTTNTNLNNLKTKVDNGQNHKITNDDGTAINSVGADLNNLTNTGTYVGNNWINAPSINYALVEVKKGTSGIIKQLFTETTSTKQYLRIFRSGVWTTWRSL